MITESMLASLERTSRTSAVLMALGALIVASALWVATSSLTSIQTGIYHWQVNRRLRLSG